MTVTKDFKELVKRRAATEPAFAKELAEAGLSFVKDDGTESVRDGSPKGGDAASGSIDDSPPAS